LIRRALYGGKSAGKDFRNHLRSCMQHLDFVSCPANPDAWMRPAKHGDGSCCYEHMVLCTNDALVVSENAEQVLRNELGRCFTLKEESIRPPKTCGRCSSTMELNVGPSALPSMSSHKECGRLFVQEG
jgi:hypothetical protein